MGEFMEFPLPGESQTATLEMAFEHAQRAVALDDTDYEGHSMLAMCYLYRRNCDLAKKHLDRAIRLNPNAADTLAYAAYQWALLGDAGQAIECGKAALRLNPHQPDWYLGFLAVAFFTARNYAEAFALRSRAPDVFIDSRFFGAAILAHMGRVDEAKRWAEKALARLMATPGGALAIDEGRVVDLLLENNPYFREEDRSHFAEGMRKAGVPG
jgi:tetratricopeptide (TPR) repeat protein